MVNKRFCSSRINRCSFRCILSGSRQSIITFGLYCLSALVPMCVVRKPGSAVLGSVITAVVNILVGSPYGINIVVAGLLQGAGAEVGFGIRKYNNFGIGSFTLRALFITLFVTIRDYFIFGYNLLPIGTLLVVIIIRILSALIIGGGLAMLIAKGLRKAGVVKTEEH
ncbi:hypothetical protein AZF37_05200 [endosymbiont 'TC1' of Trimyema compressum]|uniref:ECF transporter S component n=1 Tax=endosymbiont 'TC1' of Trimyema compressum TaxID=243899 RepID=UPI0007F17E53|nr:ECF transporter S component [endosymbiont 'TC1' of Trimyema compressum]AMP20655.1 hypothetical protein AZF37_05200 [endosymbiont 'TC1' of Trimyema compressum]